ncbi:MAG: RIP metalloprotease RseP [Planctomycetota bacterium]
MNVLLAILGIGFLIFVHELGHFLAAKRVGIRVETFALGFQPTIFGWKARIFALRRGETEYVIGLLPFGGYVKMAGEEQQDPRTGAADEYASKSPSQRAFVLVAGAAMNLIFGVILFAIAFPMGVSFPSTRLGPIAPDSPAWEAGLRSGDRVVSLAGDPKRDFTDLQTSLALSSRDAELTIEVERAGADGERERVETKVTPRLDRARGMMAIGIQPASSAVVSAVTPGSAAATAGLQVGDRVESFRFNTGDGPVRLPDGLDFSRQFAALEAFLWSGREGSIELTVSDASGATRDLSIPTASIERTGPELLGIVMGGTRVRAVQPGSPLRDHFPVGAEITSIDGTPVTGIDMWSVLSLTPADASTVRVGFADGSASDVPRRALIDGVDRIGEGDLRLVGDTPTVTAVRSGSIAATIGLRPGDLLLALAGGPVDGPLVAGAPLAPGDAILWQTRDEFVEARVPEGVPPAPLGVETRAPVRVVQVMAGSAAAAAGILPGDVIAAVAGEAVLGREDFFVRFAAVREASSGAVQLGIERGGERLDLSVTPTALSRSLGVGFPFDQVTIQTSLGEAVTEGWNQSVVWGKRIFLMLGALARQDVAPRNLAGPVGIVHIGKRVADEGFSKLLYVLAMISINLGVFNLLPFPILDGGHLLFLLIEKLKGSPVDERVQGLVHLGAFVILIGLALYVTYHDILRLFG